MSPSSSIFTPSTLVAVEVDHQGQPLPHAKLTDRVAPTLKYRRERQAAGIRVAKKRGVSMWAEEGHEQGELASWQISVARAVRRCSTSPTS